MRTYKFCILALTVGAALLLAACGTTKQAGGGASDAGRNGAAYVRKVMANAQTAQTVTAKMKARVQFGDKDISLGGSLKMKRDDVIQLSLTFLGMEVGRMEFTQNEVLIVDRVNRQYARVPYNKVKFLESASLDFYTLQSLFWNELFVPGKHDVATQADAFSVASSGEHTLLTLTGAPRLDYKFLTVTQSGLLDRTTVYSKNVSETDNLECRYGSFVKLGGKPFPSTVNLSFKGEKNVSLDLNLSGLDNATGWSTRTEVSSKYKPMDVERLLSKMTGN